MKFFKNETKRKRKKFLHNISDFFREEYLSRFKSFQTVARIPLNILNCCSDDSTALTISSLSSKELLEKKNCYFGKKMLTFLYFYCTNLL